MKVLIVGAGPAGLSCAYELVKNGIEVEVFEASDYVGGMSRSFDLWGQRVDVGPHRFFSKEKQVNVFFNEVLEGDYTVVNRLTRIFYDKQFFTYPLRLSNVFRNLSLLTILKILRDYCLQKITPIKKPATFEEWVINKFGKKLFKLFFKSYSEKLWGIPCSEIDMDWASQRIQTLSLSKAIFAALKNNKSNEHKTLVDQFKYPNNGTGTLYEKCSKFIKENGGKIHLNRKVKKVLVNNSNCANGLLLYDNSIVKADIVVSSMPLTNLLKGFDDLPEKIGKTINKLTYRNTILVYLELDGTNLFSDNWLYIHSNNVKHGRITNFRNWGQSLHKDKNTTILCLEFWASKTDKLWSKEDEEISILAESELRSLNLFSDKVAVMNQYVLRVPKSYPIYRTGYKLELEILQEFLDGFKNLVSIGRYGAFKYNNQDHSILMGLLTAQNILKGTPTNLWGINTDSTYQENE